MGKNSEFLKRKLRDREVAGNLRNLPAHEENLIDFASNDYLGLARNRQLFQRIHERANVEKVMSNGGTGSRLLTGNHRYYSELENYLKEVFHAEAALVFNSGYVANQAVLSCIPGRGDTILYDRLAHVCIKEGAWLSKADSFAFAHNDIMDLEKRIARAKGQVFVAIESVYSMDGDEAPIVEILDTCEKYGAFLIVDEAHSTGIYGDQGGGWLIAKDLEERVFARVYTFGKGMGVHGACVAGDKALIDYLVNFGRSFIYTTSLPPHSVISIIEAFRYLGENQHLQNELQNNIDLFRSLIDFETLSNTCIQPVLIPGNEHCRNVSSILQKKGFDIRPILSPTVKEGEERLRVSLHVHNSEEEIKALVKELNHELASL